jgi:hypothetical protein
MSTRITEALNCVNHALMVLPLPSDGPGKRAWSSLLEAQKLLDSLSTEPKEAEGMVLVPREPTLEMIQAWIGYYGGDLGEGFSHQARAVWEAMLAAAPLPEDTHHGR